MESRVGHKTPASTKLIIIEHISSLRWKRAMARSDGEPRMARLGAADAKPKPSRGCNVVCREADCTRLTSAGSRRGRSFCTRSCSAASSSSALSSGKHSASAASHTSFKSRKAALEGRVASLQPELLNRAAALHGSWPLLHAFAASTDLLASVGLPWSAASFFPPSPSRFPHSHLLFPFPFPYRYHAPFRLSLAVAETTLCKAPPTTNEGH